MKTYIVIDWYDNKHVFTAKGLYKRVLEDSKSDYNWIAPARELVRICSKKGFPKEYAIGIKVAILNCFANIEYSANCGGDRHIDSPADKIAVQYCYNSLYGINNEEASMARKRYLTEMIDTASYTRIFDPLFHPGPTFRSLRKNWGNSKFEEYISRKNINFKQLVETLHDDFVKVIKNAEASGAFEEDEKKDNEEMKKICDIMKNF